MKRSINGLVLPFKQYRKAGRKKRKKLSHCDRGFSALFNINAMNPFMIPIFME